MESGSESGSRTERGSGTESGSRTERGSGTERGTERETERGSGRASGEGPARRVRYRTDRDLDDCVRLLAEVHEHDGYPVNWPEHPRSWLTPASLLAAWVVRLDGRIAGHAGLARSAPGDAAPALRTAPPGPGGDATAVVSRLFVAPWARGHGIGTSLMERVTADARARGLHPVLDVLASDTAATALYERLGWQLLDTVERQWGPKRVTLRCYAAPLPAR